MTILSIQRMLDMKKNQSNYYKTVAEIEKGKYLYAMVLMAFVIFLFILAFILSLLKNIKFVKNRN